MLRSMNATGQTPSSFSDGRDCTSLRVNAHVVGSAHSAPHNNVQDHCHSDLIPTTPPATLQNLQLQIHRAMTAWQVYAQHRSGSDNAALAAKILYCNKMMTKPYTECGELVACLSHHFKQVMREEANHICRLLP